MFPKKKMYAHKFGDGRTYIEQTEVTYGVNLLRQPKVVTNPWDGEQIFRLVWRCFYLLA